jgi:hypothetical protein
MPIANLATWLQLIAQLEPEAAALIIALLGKLTGQTAANIATMDADPVWQAIAAKAQAEIDKTPK